MLLPPNVKPKRRPKLEARTTISLDQAAYDALLDIAYDKCVSVGCIVREAVANYIAESVSATPKSARRGTGRGRK